MEHKDLGDNPIEEDNGLEARKMLKETIDKAKSKRYVEPELQQVQMGMEDELSLRDIVDIVWKFKIMIVAIAVVSVVIGFGFLMLKNANYSAETIIEVSFSGISEGKNPDGTIFDLNTSMKDVSIIKKALTDANITTVTAEDVRSKMAITPIVPGDIEEIIKSKLQKGEAYSYHPTKFEINIDFDRKVPKKDATVVLEAIIREYVYWHMQTYSDRRILANVMKEIDFERYDYPEISMALQESLSVLNNYIRSLPAEAQAFRGKKNGYALSDIAEGLNLLREVDVNRASSIINNNLLTKNKEHMIMKYEYMIKTYELQRQKKLSESQSALDMMSKYQKSQNTLLIPGLTDVSGANPQTQSNDAYYDALVQRSTDASVEASNKQYDIAYYQNEITLLKQDSIPKVQKDSAIKDVNNLLSALKTKLDYWITTANDTIEEYYVSIFDNRVMMLYPAGIVHPYSTMMILAVAGGGGLVLGIFVAFLRYFLQNGR